MDSLPFDAGHWYWWARNGSIYCSARNVLVSNMDPTYLEFIARYGGCTPWPVDDSGQQTADSLKAVLSSYGIDVTPPAP
jgi:hypothetical protein